jgi:hypothetical protein
MRLSPTSSLAPPFNYTTAKASTQANPSSPSKNARSGFLFLQKENVPKIQLNLENFRQHVMGRFGDKLNPNELHLISTSAQKAESSSLADYVLQIIENELGFDASRLIFKQPNTKDHVVIEKMRIPAVQNEQTNPNALAQTSAYTASLVSTTVTYKDIEPPHSDVLVDYINGTPL